MRPKILVLYHITSFPLRATVRDLLYCYREYGDAECVYVNTAGRKELPSGLYKIPFDLIIFHTVFISLRWGGDAAYESVRQLLAPLINHPARKIVLPQDEWIHTTVLNRFIREFGIQSVYTVAPESEWPKIYHDVDFSKVSFHYVLTGYIETSVVNRVCALPARNRNIDIGYRAYKAPPWLGRHGFLKTDIADVFNREAPAAGFHTDISTRAADTILGDQWYDFLLSCRYFIGLEGGSTILDPDGSIWAKGEAYMKTHPEAGFEEVEQAVFPGLDGNLNLIAISPRHLECCITRTTQVLMEGDYNGILKPNRHYIPLRKDYSNLQEVFKQMKDESYRTEMAQNAWQDIVASGTYHYENFVSVVLRTAIGYTPAKPQPHETRLTLQFRQEEERYNQSLQRKAEWMSRLSNVYRRSGLKNLIQKLKT